MDAFKQDIEEGAVAKKENG